MRLYIIWWQWQYLSFLLPFARYYRSQCAWPWPWSLRMEQGQIQVCQSKDHMRLSMLTIATFSLTNTVCEIITFERPNVLDSNLDIENDGKGRWRLGSKLADERALSKWIRAQKEIVLLGSVVCSQYIIVHFVTCVHTAF